MTSSTLQSILYHFYCVIYINCYANFSFGGHIYLYQHKICFWNNNNKISSVLLTPLLPGGFKEFWKMGGLGWSALHFLGFPALVETKGSASGFKILHFVGFIQFSWRNFAYLFVLILVFIMLLKKALGNTLGAMVCRIMWQYHVCLHKKSDVIIHKYTC